MRCRILFITGAALVVIALSLVASFARSSAAATSVQTATTGSTTFTDPAGDRQGLAPDLTTITLSDNPSTGTIVVNVTAVGYAAAAEDSYPMVVVYLNTDKNTATGAPNQLGADYRLGAFREPGGWGWSLHRWDGSQYVLAPQSSTMNFSRAGDVLIWTFNKSDIGNSTGFAFVAWSSTWDANDNQTGEDNAPDDGTWSYDLQAAPPAPTTTTTPTTTPSPPPAAVKAVIGAPKTTPASATAGKRLTVVFPVTRSDTGVPLTTGKMICDPSITGKVLPHSEQFKSGKAKLSFAIPKTAKGKLLRVKVTIKVGTRSTTRIATFRIH